MSEEALACPECGEEFLGPQAPMRRGAHRRREHSYVSDKPKRPKGRRARGGDRAPRAPRAKGSSLKADLRKGFKLAGRGLTKMGDKHCGEILEKKSASFCNALAEVLEESPLLKSWIHGVAKRSPYIALVVAGAELAAPIAAHHGGVELGGRLAVRAVSWWRGSSRQVPSVEAAGERLGFPVDDGQAVTVDEYARDFEQPR